MYNLKMVIFMSVIENLSEAKRKELSYRLHNCIAGIVL